MRGFGFLSDTRAAAAMARAYRQRLGAIRNGVRRQPGAVSDSGCTCDGGCGETPGCGCSRCASTKCSLAEPNPFKSCPRLAQDARKNALHANHAASSTHGQHSVPADSVTLGSRGGAPGASGSGCGCEWGVAREGEQPCTLTYRNGQVVTVRCNHIGGLAPPCPAAQAGCRRLRFDLVDYHVIGLVSSGSLTCEKQGGAEVCTQDVLARVWARRLCCYVQAAEETPPPSGTPGPPPTTMCLEGLCPPFHIDNVFEIPGSFTWLDGQESLLAAYMQSLMERLDTDCNTIKCPSAHPTRLECDKFVASSHVTDNFVITEHKYSYVQLGNARRHFATWRLKATCRVQCCYRE